jgi:hypothetical protein
VTDPEKIKTYDDIDDPEAINRSLKCSLLLVEGANITLDGYSFAAIPFSNIITSILKT